MKYISTRDWDILQGERIRRWPGSWGGARKIRVDINSWKGLSLGAKHWNVTVTEEDNQWWCEPENAWVEIYRDSEKSGYSLTAAVFTPEEAAKVTKQFVAIILAAGKENGTDHEIVTEGYADEIVGNWSEIGPENA